MKKHLILCLAVIIGLVVGCSDGPEKAGEGGDVAIGDAAEDARWPDGSSYSDGEIGLAEGTLFETLTPDLVEINTSDFGERELFPRAYPTSPPRIPHGITDLDPITLDENLCIECHNGDDAKATPPSHFVGPSGKTTEEISGARYACTLCHVPQTNAKPLVSNLFED